MARTKKANARAASNEDVLLGAKIRTFRNLAKVSQDELGKALNPPVSFQQIQKYEKGVNRVSHTKLGQICKALNCTMADMTTDLRGDGQTTTQSSQVVAMLGDAATFRLVKAFSTLPRDMQFKFVGLLETVAHGIPA
jgi:transcriptional regulator with XRE-family HTH domain